MNFHEALEIFKGMSKPSPKASIVLGDNDYMALKVFDRNTPKVIKQTIIFEPLGVCVPRSNFAFKLIDDTMRNLNQFGIASYYVNYLKFLLRPQPELPSEPRVFSLSDLEFGFVSWLIACGVCILVFIGEVLKYRLRILFQKYVGLYYFMKILRKQRLRCNY